LAEQAAHAETMFASLIDLLLEGMIGASFVFVFGETFFMVMAFD